MKVLFVTNWFPSDQKPVSGLFVKDQARAVKEAGAEVKILHLRARHAPRWYHVEIHNRQIEGMETVSLFIESRLFHVLQYAAPLFYKWAFWLLKEYFSSFKPDIIHGNVVYPAGFISRRIAEKYDCPLHLSEHWSKAAAFLRKPLIGKKARQVYESCDYVYPVSFWLKEKLARELENTGHFKVIPNVIDPELFHYSPKQENTSSKVVLLAVLNFAHKTKRPDILIKAVKLLDEEEQQKIELICVGAGQNENNWPQYVDSLSVKADIHFKGIQPKSKVAAYMQHADFLVHPTETETFGLTVAEALTTGLPVIASRRGAIPELIDESSGFLVEKNTGEQWKKALAWAIAHKGSFCRNKIAGKYDQEFSPRHVGEKLMNYYRNSLRNS